MKNLLKKAILVGLGAGALTKEKLDKAYLELHKEVKKGKLSTSEGKKFVKKLLVESKKERKRIESLAERELKYLVKTSGLNKANLEKAKSALTKIEGMLEDGKKTKKKKAKKK